MREIIQIKHNNIGKIKKKKKVCAYARVSLNTDRMRNSLSAQISYYNNLIQNNPEWEFKGVYADLGISGTSTKKREQFNKMLEECNKGNIDIILTKSIQRFARNTIDLLEIVRDLKLKGIEVRFEKENINSMSGDGELMLSILASFAQEESRQISENVKWGIRKRIEKGMLHASGHFNIYGYRWKGDTLVADPEESKIVKMMYEDYLKGSSVQKIYEKLNSMGVKTRHGKEFKDSNTRQILKNSTYTGNMTFQKEYIVDPISKKSKNNKGELPKYILQNSHQTIIEQELFDKVQAEFKRRREGGAILNPAINTSELTSKIRCIHCNKNFTRKTGHITRGSTKSWACSVRRNSLGNPCGTKDLHELSLKNIIAKVLNIKEYDKKKVEKEIERIEVRGKDDLTFIFKNGKTKNIKYESVSRTYFWTDEYRELYKKKKRNKHQSPIKNRATAYTGLIECARCGNAFSSFKNTLKNGAKVTYMFCRTKRTLCPKNSIQLSTLKQLTNEVLNIKEFDEDIMDQNIERIYIADNRVRFEFKNGTEITKRYL